MRAIAIVAQNPSHGPAIDVAIDAVLPGIDLERQQCFAHLDHDPRPLVHFFCFAAVSSNMTSFMLHYFFTQITREDASVPNKHHSSDLLSPVAEQVRESGWVPGQASPGQ
jgi:hypothetical protein